MLIQFCGNLILICINSICLRMCLQRLHDFVKRIGCQQIIMIQKSEKVSLCHGKCPVCILCNTQIFFQVTKTHPLIPGCILCQNSLHLFIIRTCIGNAKFPYSISLSCYRIDHLFQEFYGSLIGRYYNTDQRLIFKSVSSLSVQRCLIRGIGLIPWGIGHFLRLKSFMKTNPEFLWPIMLQISKTLLHCIGRKFLQNPHPLDFPPCRLLFIHVSTSIFCQ